MSSYSCTRILESWVTLVLGHCNIEFHILIEFFLCSGITTPNCFCYSIHVLEYQIAPILDHQNNNLLSYLNTGMSSCSCTQALECRVVVVLRHWNVGLLLYSSTIVPSFSCTWTLNAELLLYSDTEKSSCSYIWILECWVVVGSIIIVYPSIDNGDSDNPWIILFMVMNYG